MPVDVFGHRGRAGGEPEMDIAVSGHGPGLRGFDVGIATTQNACEMARGN